MPYTLLTDEELFAMVRDHGDDQAFRTLFKRYDKRVYAYCLRALGSHDDARDVFQTIQLTVFDKRASFHDGSFAAWLFTISRNFCLKTLRGRKHTVEITDEVVTVEPEETHSSDFLLRQALHTAISRLPDEFREALSMKYFDDLPYEDIAATLDITVALAKVRVFRAKKLIQQSMSTIIDELR